MVKEKHLFSETPTGMKGYTQKKKKVEKQAARVKSQKRPQASEGTGGV